MGKLFVCLLVLLSLCSSTARAWVSEYDGVEDLPAASADHLSSSERWSSYEITGWANPDGQADGFVALHKKGDNELLCFRLKDGAWQYAWHNDGALPDNDEPFILQDATGSGNAMTGETNKEPTLWAYYVLNDELCDYGCFYEKQNGSWLLTGYTFYEPSEFYADVYASRLEIRLSDVQKYPETVEGVIERSLRYIDAETLPRTIKEAEKKLSNPPEIPQGELEAERIKFTGGKKYKVYDGPGEHFGQAGSGKAVVSTNDWIQVFGRQGEWIMIQYDISSEKMRIGWIQASALPKNAQVAELDFTQQRAWVTVGGASVTDDPLFSQVSIALLSEGTAVSLLSTMGDWSYIQVYSADPMYGFIKSSMLRTESLQERIQRQGSNALTEVYGYSQQEVDDQFVFHGVVTGDELSITMYPKDHPSWIYESVFSVATGKHIRSSSPFGTDHPDYPGEGTFRYTLDTALGEGWLYNWQWEDRALLRQWLVQWQQPMTDALEAGLESGDISPMQAVTELFLASYGPRDGWPHALQEWHDEAVQAVEENYQGNG